MGQAEKDGRMVELLQLASAHGWGDLDPEPAVGLLEDTGWDVAEAFARLCGTRQMRSTLGASGHGNDALFWPGPDASAELELLRMQQEEWDQGLAAADADAAVRHVAQRAAAARHGARHEVRHPMAAGHDLAATPRSPGTSHSPNGNVPSFGVAGANGAHRRSGMFRGSGSSGELSSDETPSEGETTGGLAVGPPGRPHMAATAALAGLGSSLLNRGMLDEAYALAAEQDDEAISFHALVHALIQTQDEADLQDAVRLSAEEAYSGGFGVPPADEAALAHITRTSTYRGTRPGEPPGQCSVCLGDFEIGDSLRMLQCRHEFHMACVDQWLAQSGQCPICKQRVGQ